MAEDKPPEETPAPPGSTNLPPISPSGSAADSALLDPKYLAIHRLALISAAVILTVTNFFVGQGWWSLWPLFGWGIIFFFHLCLVRATNVDEEWVNERTDDLRLKSYDLGHIDDIDERYNTGARIGATRRMRREQGPIEFRYPLIDAHHHFWDLERNYHPWLRDEPLVRGRHGDYSAIRDTYLPDHYRMDWSQMNVVRSVHVEAEWDRDNELGETQWLHEINEVHGFPNAIVAHAQLDDPNVGELIAQHRKYPLVRGIRHKPTAAGSADEVVTGAPGSMSDPVWRKGYALLQDYGLSFDLQTPYWHLGEAADLARAFPRTLIIVNHTGLPTHRDEASLSQWRDAMTTAAAVPNIVVKISGLGEPHLQPWTVSRHLDVVVDTIEIFGAERCMFGSNFPVDRLYAPYETIMRGFMEMTRIYSMAERRAMFHDNAAAYYRIDV